MDILRFPSLRLAFSRASSLIVLQTDCHFESVPRIPCGFSNYYLIPPSPILKFRVPLLLVWLSPIAIYSYTLQHIPRSSESFQGIPGFTWYIAPRLLPKSVPRFLDYARSSYYGPMLWNCFSWGQLTYLVILDSNLRIKLQNWYQLIYLSSWNIPELMISADIVDISRKPGLMKVGWLVEGLSIDGYQAK